MSQKYSKRPNRSAGFTIIEVLIVLAIAGLILLIVFLAVPALQRNSRNTSIKNDVQNVLGGVSEFQGANNGIMPDAIDGTGTVTYKLTSGGNSTSINIQGATVVSSAKAVPITTTPDPGTVAVAIGYRCDNTKSARATSA